MNEDAGKMELQLVQVENPEELNLILGQAHFIKTVEDLHEALAGAVPGLRFGIAFCEASGPRLVRRSGNDQALVELAVRNALSIGAGHSFIVFLREGFPVNVLGQVKLVPEVCRIYCATANPVQVIVAGTRPVAGSSASSTGARRSAWRAKPTSQRASDCSATSATNCEGDLREAAASPRASTDRNDRLARMPANHAAA